MATKKIKLDVWSNEKQTIHILKGESNSRFLEISLLENGIPISLENKSVQLYMKKPDNNIIYNDIQIIDRSNGIICIEFTYQMSSSAGISTDIEIRIISDTGALLKIKSLNIIIQNSLDDSQIESSSEFSALTNAMINQLKMNNHMESIYNPHMVTADQVGAIPNTRSINGKSLKSDITLSYSDLNSVPNTRTINNKALSEDIELNSEDIGAISTVEKGNSNGVATLNSNGKLTSSQLDTSSDSYKIKLLNLSEEVQAAMAGTAPVISSVADGSLTTAKYADNSITTEKTSFFREPTRNLLNKTDDDYLINYGISGAGVIVSSNEYDTSGYISVEPGEKIFISKDSVAISSTNQVYFKALWYDSNKTLLSTGNPTVYNGERGYVVPSGAAYMRTSIGWNKSTGNYQVEKAENVYSITSYVESLALNKSAYDLTDNVYYKDLNFCCNIGQPLGDSSKVYINTTDNTVAINNGFYIASNITNETYKGIESSVTLERDISGYFYLIYFDTETRRISFEQTPAVTSSLDKNVITGTKNRLYLGYYNSYYKRAYSHYDCFVVDGVENNGKIMDDWFKEEYISYPEIEKTIKNSLIKLTTKDKDFRVVMVGDSITARETHNTQYTAAEAVKRPPQLVSKNIASGIYDKIAWNNDEYSRFDSAGVFTETGTFSTLSSLSGVWDDGGVRPCITRRSTSTVCGVSFDIDISVKRFNFIYRTDTTASENVKISVSGGTNKVKVFDGTAWIEANGYEFSMKETPSTATKGNTTYNKILRLKLVDNTSDQTITISKNEEGTAFNYWGIQTSTSNAVLEFINSGRGSATIEILKSKFDNEVIGHKPDLIIFEVPLLNMGCYYGQTSTPLEQFNRWYDIVLNPNEDTSLYSKTNGFDGIDIIFWLPNMTNHNGFSNGVPNNWEIDGHAVNTVDYYKIFKVKMLELNLPIINLGEAFIIEAKRMADCFNISFETALSASGNYTGNTLLHDVTHPNDNGVKVALKYLLPMF